MEALACFSAFGLRPKSKPPTSRAVVNSREEAHRPATRDEGAGYQSAFRLYRGNVILPRQVGIQARVKKMVERMFATKLLRRWAPCTLLAVIAAMTGACATQLLNDKQGLAMQTAL